MRRSHKLSSITQMSINYMQVHGVGTNSTQTSSNSNSAKRLCYGECHHTRIMRLGEARLVASTTSQSVLMLKDLMFTSMQAHSTLLAFWVRCSLSAFQMIASWDIAE